MDIKYLTTFELMNERERKLLSSIGRETRDIGYVLGNKISEIYRKTPVVVKAGSLLVLGAALALGGRSVLEKKVFPTEPEKICVSYKEERAPVAYALEVDTCVTLEELKRLKSNPYVFDLK